MDTEGHMPEIIRHRTATPRSDLFDWLENTLPAGIDWRWNPLERAMRLEDKIEDDKYTLRAELPGLDPDKDVEITVADGVLSISAERREEKSDKDHSEFRYGSFVRRVTLPSGAQTDQLKATYKDGILQVVVPVTPTAGKARKIPVSRGKSS
jgi:HSP20 family molecular chaperone IbpA